MPTPQDVAYASQQFQDWLLDLRSRALLGSTHQAYAMLRAVLHEIRDRLQVDDALRFADALPPLVRGIMLERWRPPGAAPATRPPFLDAVKSRLEPHTPPPDSVVEDVLTVLAQRTQPNLLSTLSEHMPVELQPQWRA
ncbi:MAG TPA: DUF2267 domain-containing protein, partial [Anaeromyxobacteraceae bacterium]